MPTHIRATVLLIVALTVAVSTSLSSLRPRQPTGEVAQDQKALQRPQDEDEEQYPTVDYDSLGAADPEKKEKRKVKNARHDKSHIVKEDNPMVRRSVYHSEWDLGLPALPIDECNDSGCVGNDICTWPDTDGCPPGYDTYD